MDLTTYQKKRNFRNTPEPEGKSEASDPDNLRFVVQKHAARKLHYDFRLELNGVLLSWAIPKGPSLIPGEQRLAVRTEDHPLAYGGFEGVIPEGQYGSGTVLLWDHGRWEPKGDPEAGLKKGSLSLELHGERLKGSFKLVRMQGSGAESWLLIKSRDEYAYEKNAKSVVDDYVTSVISDKTIDDIGKSSLTAGKKQKPKIAPPQEKELLSIKGARKEKVSWPVSPQLPTLVDKPVTGDQWLNELKLDGYRLLIWLQKGKVSLFTRSGHNWTDRLETIANIIPEAFAVDNAVIDCELVALDAKGRTSFGALQKAITGDQSRLYLYAFDLLQAGNVNLRDVPLLQRKEILQKLILPGQDRVRYNDHVIGNAPDVLQQACRLEIEGIVSKKINAPYREGRGRDWLKVKCSGREEFIIGGYVTREQNSLASLLLGKIEDNKLVYIGRVGTGFDNDDSRLLLERFSKLESRQSPFGNKKLPTYAGDKLHWVKPEILIEVKFSGWTNDGILRHASFQGIREDKPARQMDLPDLSNIRITHPDKILYPESGLTKGELAAWTALMAPWILPHIVDRPLMLMRCPDGRKGQCFFQKHYENLPDSVHAVKIKGYQEPYIAINDVEGLLALVQMGTLEIHPWGARIDRIDRPDRLIFDLDPDSGITFAKVINAAYEVRDFLNEIGLQSWVRWTGGKGLHVVVPLTRRNNWDEVKQFAKMIAYAMTKQQPKRYVATASKEKRKGKIFIDWLRNGFGATAIASWCFRARENAPVAALLQWTDLNSDIDLSHYRVPDLQPPVTDPWEGFFDVKQSIKASWLNKGL